MVGNRQSQKQFGKQTKWILLSNILFQTQQRPNRKKVMAFWRKSGTVSRGNLPENPEKPTWPFVGFWLLTSFLSANTVQKTFFFWKHLLFFFKQNQIQQVKRNLFLSIWRLNSKYTLFFWQLEILELLDLKWSCLSALFLLKISMLFNLDVRCIRITRFEQNNTNNFFCSFGLTDKNFLFCLYFLLVKERVFSQSNLFQAGAWEIQNFQKNTAF